MVMKIYPSEKVRRQAEYIRARAKVLAARPPDPILSFSKTDLAYIAGLLDGDGWFRVTKVGGHSRYFYPEIGVAMTYRPVIEWLQEKLSCGSIKVNNHTRVSEGWKPQVGIKLHGGRAQLLARHLLPYLRVKHEHAQIIATFPAEGRTGPGKPVADDIVAARKAAFEQMKALNHRGKE